MFDSPFSGHTVIDDWTYVFNCLSSVTDCPYVRTMWTDWQSTGKRRIPIPAAVVAFEVVVFLAAVVIALLMVEKEASF